ncbi:YCII-related protein [Gongronella butleri]|nr:YCII-related protein [Gongronella butleri]
MNSKVPRKQFIVLIDDYKDEQALERRLAVRDKHLVSATLEHEQGNLLCGGALFDSHESRKMIGSMMICQAESQAELEERLAKDPYVLGKVWEKWTILPYRNVSA